MTPECTFPRLRGKAKAALVAVEFDEYGGGRADRMHSQLYADLLDGAGMSTGYLHFAAAEITTGPSAQRMVQALQGLNADPRCVEFYTEHIEADAVHEQIMRHDVIGSLLEQEPSLKPDVVFGVQATNLLAATARAHRHHEPVAGASRRRR